MTTQAGYIYLLGNEAGRYSLERTPDKRDLTEHFQQLIHSFPVDDLAASFYFLAGRFSKCEGAEYEAMSPTDVALFKRIRGGELEAIIADVVLPDRPRQEQRVAEQLLSDLQARHWRIELIGSGGFILTDEHGLHMTPEEWNYLRTTLDYGYQKRAEFAILMENWVRCGELIKSE
jgi:hypothetical protein